MFICEYMHVYIYVCVVAVYLHVFICMYIRYIFIRTNTYIKAYTYVYILFVHICNYLYLYAGWTFDRISGLQVVALLLGPELQKAESPGTHTAAEYVGFGSGSIA